MDTVGDVLQVAGLVVAALVVYTLVTLGLLVWLGHRYQQFRGESGVALPAARRPAGRVAA